MTEIEREDLQNEIADEILKYRSDDDNDFARIRNGWLQVASTVARIYPLGKKP